jgi:hypothetical protein
LVGWFCLRQQRTSSISVSYAHFKPHAHSSPCCQPSNPFPFSLFPFPSPFPQNPTAIHSFIHSFIYFYFSPRACVRAFSQRNNRHRKTSRKNTRILGIGWWRKCILFVGWWGEMEREWWEGREKETPLHCKKRTLREQVYKTPFISLELTISRFPSSLTRAGQEKKEGGKSRVFYI